MTRFTFQRHRVISVVGGGWSVTGEGWDIGAMPGFVIGVNDAGVRLPRCDEVVSMDREWVENRHSQCIVLKRRLWARRSVLKNIEMTPDLEEILSPFECDHETAAMAGELGRLNGTNSGGCAINRAFQRARGHSGSVVLLFGFDMCEGPNGEKHWYDNYDFSKKRPRGTTNGSFKKWAAEFRIITRQFEAINTPVYNMSKRSKIDAFPRIRAGELEIVDA